MCFVNEPLVFAELQLLQLEKENILFLQDTEFFQNFSLMKFQQ